MARRLLPVLLLLLAASPRLAGFAAPSLSDPGLHRWLQRALGRPYPPPRWTLAWLTETAFYCHPRVRVARAQVQQAQAAALTAAEVPNPTLHLRPELEFPWILSVGLALDVPHVPIRQRRLAVAAARQRAEAAALALGRAAWDVRTQVRQALLGIRFADRERALLQQQVDVFTQWDAAAAQQVELGEAARPDALSVALRRSASQRALEAARLRCHQARAALAAAVGIPLPELLAIPLAPDSAGPPPPPEALSRSPLEAMADRNRLDVAAARAQVRAAETRVRLELARRSPGVTWSPSYNEQGNHDVGLGFAVALPLRNHNQGPVAEAVAARELALARFTAAEQQARLEVDSAWRQYRDAHAAAVPAREQLQAAAARELLAFQAMQAGETNLAAALAARLDTLGAQQEVNAADSRIQQALGTLENAVEAPLAGEESAPAKGLEGREGEGAGGPPRAGDDAEKAPRPGAEPP